MQAPEPQFTIARASLEELLLDYQDFLRQQELPLRTKEHPQANYLLDQQLRQLEKEFLQEGGFTEKLYHARVNARNTDWKKR